MNGVNLFNLTGVRYMRVLAILLGTAALASAEDKFVKVPYARAVDEVVFGEVKAGRITNLPKHVRVKDGNVEIGFGDGGSDVTKLKWNNADDGRFSMFTYMVFPDAKYDSDGFYLMSESAYASVKGKLIHKHKGYVLSFNNKEPLKPGEVRDTSIRPDDWLEVVWDLDDKCWRWPTTLARVPKDFKLNSGKAMPNVPPPPVVTVDPEVIEDVLNRKKK